MTLPEEKFKRVMFDLECPFQCGDCLRGEGPLLAPRQGPAVTPPLVVLDGPVMEVHELLAHGVLEQRGEVLEEVHHVGPLCLKIFKTFGALKDRV